jgi:energy-coupling factor transporter transmembrane protein EcfT
MLYRHGHSVLHRAGPLTKLALIVLAATMLPLWPAPVLLATAALALLAGALCRIGWAMVRRLALILLPVGLALFVVHGFMLENGPAQPLGPVDYYPQGLARALTYFARIALLLSVSLLVVMTTRVNDLARALDQRGLPPALSYLLTAPLNLIDGIADEAAAIRDSLQVRGLSARSGLAARARLLGAMLAPLVRDMIAEAGTRAEALDARGFRALPRRSLLDPLTETRAEAHLRMAILLASALQVGMALWA